MKGDVSGRILSDCVDLRRIGPCVCSGEFSLDRTGREWCDGQGMIAICDR